MSADVLAEILRKRAVVERGGLGYYKLAEEALEALPALAARLAEVEQDLKNERHDIEMVCHEVSLVYDHVTNGFASKPHTTAFEIISLADDHISKLVDEEVKERAEAAESLNTTIAGRLKEAEEALKFYADPISHMTTPTSEELKALIALVEARRDWLSWYFAKHPERSIPAPEDIELYGRLSSALTALKCEIEEMREAAANIKNVNTVTDILNEEVRKVLAETRTSLSVAKGALQRISELSFKRAGVYAADIARQALASIPEPDNDHGR